MGVGFLDGVIELYHLSISPKSVLLKKLMTMDGTSKQPVTNLVFSNGHLFISRIHEVEAIKECLSGIAQAIINDSL